MSSCYKVTWHINELTLFVPDVVVVTFDPSVTLLTYPRDIVTRIGGPALVCENCLELIVATVVGAEIVVEAKWFQVNGGVRCGLAVLLECSLATFAVQALSVRLNDSVFMVL